MTISLLAPVSAHQPRRPAPTGSGESPAGSVGMGRDVFKRSAAFRTPTSGPAKGNFELAELKALLDPAAACARPAG